MANEIRSLDDVLAPQDGVAFFTWGTSRDVVFEFKSEFGEPRFSRQGLLEATVLVNGTEFIFAPGSRRLLFAMKPFAPLRGKQIRVVVVGEGMKREFAVSDVSRASSGPRNAKLP